MNWYRRLPGRAWSGSYTLIVVVVPQVLPTLWGAYSPYPETKWRMNSAYKWTVWEPRSGPCITVEETLRGEVSVSADRNLPAVRAVMTSMWTSLQEAVIDLAIDFSPSELLDEEQLQCAFIWNICDIHYTNDRDLFNSSDHCEHLLRRMFSWCNPKCDNAW